MTYDTINNDMTMAGGAEGALLANRYRIVRQVVSKTATVLPRNGGPVTLQLGLRSTATEAPLHRNGGPITLQRRPHYTATEAPLL